MVVGFEDDGEFLMGKAGLVDDQMLVDRDFEDDGELFFFRVEPRDLPP